MAFGPQCPLGRWHVKRVPGGRRPRATKAEKANSGNHQVCHDPRRPVICMCMHADVSRTGSHPSGFAVSELDVFLAFHQRTVLDLGRYNSSLIELSILAPSPALPSGHLGV